MTVPQFSPINPYGQVRRSELERMARTTETHDRLSGVNGLNVSRNASGLYVADARPHAIWIKITSGNNPYAWTRQYSESGVMTDDDYNGSGTASILPAYESEGNPVVPVGAIVRAWLSDDGRSYWFAYCCGQNAISGSGAGATIQTACCDNQIAAVLVATLSSSDPDAACVDTQTVTLTYDAVNQWWIGSDSFATDRQTKIVLSCYYEPGGPPYWTLQLTCYNSATGADYIVRSMADASPTCSPLSLNFDTSTGSGTVNNFSACCSGTPYADATITIEVTE